MLSTPKLRCGSFSPLRSISAVQQFTPYQDKPSIKYKPKRKSLEAPIDDGTFIKPLKQSFIRNPKLMPMTRMMLSLLSGWNGAGQGSVKTTTGTIARHLSRSNRMVFNYLQDAMEQGYLSYSKIKDRMGYYIGIKIYLNFGAIRKEFKKRENTKKGQNFAENRDRKYTSEIKNNLILDSYKDKELMTTLARFAVDIGYIGNTTNTLPDG